METFVADAIAEAAAPQLRPALLASHVEGIEADGELEGSRMAMRICTRNEAPTCTVDGTVDGDGVRASVL